MSSGSPTAGGYMRQRHSQGYASSGDDLDDDDACSKSHPQSPPFPTTRTWVEVLGYVLWIASAGFIVYLGDRHSNMIHVVFHDSRIRRIPLYLGLFGVSLKVLYFLYTIILVRGVQKSSEKLEISGADALPFITILGLVSFSLFSFALWPIWSFLTLPLVFTLFMAWMVILPYWVFRMFMKQSTDTLRID